ncbi:MULTISPECIES: helix-turn-helix domain-containing protein [Streptomyces]|uniref:helix-turn-helix domain-containing protein n=1 Tax=Streptomyces TaxID=1883 RepID=UPI0012FF2663|nr:helix-turn-helix transcriptional regulator [Streptomyces cyaneofuscatus]
MKAGSSSAVAFGRVLQAARKRWSKTQADVANFFDPKLSVAAVSMAESGSRPPKTEAMVRGYAAALELDEDALLQLWWAMQGMIGIDIWAEDLPVPQWWREFEASPQAEIGYHQARRDASSAWTPNADFYEPSLELFALAEAICTILMRLLGDSWKVGYKHEIGLRDPGDVRLAAVIIELRARVPDDDESNKPFELMATFACPEPVARPVPPEPTARTNTEAMSPDVAWILSSVEAMPARERAAVAGFIHGLREGASLFSEEVSSTPTSRTPASRGQRTRDRT